MLNFNFGPNDKCVWRGITLVKQGVGLASIRFIGFPCKIFLLDFVLVLWSFLVLDIDEYWLYKIDEMTEG